MPRPSHDSTAQKNACSNTSTASCACSTTAYKRAPTVSPSFNKQSCWAPLRPTGKPNAACAGTQTQLPQPTAAGTAWRPSGPLSKLCDLPELRPYARPINLLNAQPGILNPYRVVAEPLYEHFVDEDDPERAWRREKALAAATRRRLVLDVLSGLLPYDVARMPQTRIVLLRAVRMVGGRQDADPSLVFEALRRDASEHHEHAVVVADFLDEMRERMQLLIPEEDADPYHDDRDNRLTVIRRTRCCRLLMSR